MFEEDDKIFQHVHVSHAALQAVIEVIICLIKCAIHLDFTLCIWLRESVNMETKTGMVVVIVPNGDSWRC